MPETPKTIKEESNLLFFWERYGKKDYFTSAAHSKLLLTPIEGKLVHF